MWFIQLNENDVLVEVALSNFQKGTYGVHIREYGDLSNNYENCGPHFQSSEFGTQLKQKNFIHSGDLGDVTASENGEGFFRKIFTNQFKVWEIIGRCVVIDAHPSDCQQQQHGKVSSSEESKLTDFGLIGGIVARSAAVGENVKRICTCDDKRF